MGGERKKTEKAGKSEGHESVRCARDLLVFLAYKEEYLLKKGTLARNSQMNRSCNFGIDLLISSSPWHRNRHFNEYTIFTLFNSTFIFYARMIFNFTDYCF